MTPKEIACLKYLSDKTEATAEMCGGNLVGKTAYSHNKIWAASSSLGNLRKKGLVTRVPELNAWAITKKGRELVEKL